MLLSAVSVLVAEQSRSEIPEGLMNNPVYEWSSALTRSLGRPKNRWEDDAKGDITVTKIANWKSCIRNQTKWKKFLEKALQLL